MLKTKRRVVVDVSTVTPEVPYGKEFVVPVQYNLAAVSNGETHLRVTAGVQFFSNPLLKRVIANSAKVSDPRDDGSVWFSVMARGGGGIGPSPAGCPPFFSLALDRRAG